MSTSDGRVVRTVLIYGNGFPSTTHNLVILAEGYQEGQLSQFATDANELVQALRRVVPFNFLLSLFNIWRVDVASNGAGADDPVSGTTAATYFDATFNSSGIDRLLTVNTATAHQVARDQVPSYDWIIVSVNSAKYGGSGGDVAVYSQDPQAIEIAIHELGHSAIGLADEYDVGGPNRHPGPEPAEMNVTTTLPVSSSKWQRYVQTTTPVPTMNNPDCTTTDTRPSPLPAGTVGAFEGAHYSHCGAYRPEHNCRMRELNQPFCRVCQDAIFYKLAAFSAPWVYIWKGIFGDDRLYHGRGRDVDSQQAGFPAGANNARMTTAPAVTYYSNFAHAAWKGASQSIWYSRLGARPDGQWDEPRNVSGVGTSTGPSLASFQGKLFMAWKGIVNDQGIYFNNFSGISWTPQAGIPGVGTSTRPALAEFRGRLYMAWKGIGGDPSMFYTSFDGTSWRPQAPIPNVGTSTYPSLAVLNDRLYMAWKGIEGDANMYFTSFDGFAWQPQARIPNVGTTSGCSLAGNGRDRLFLAWSGVAPDQSLYSTTFDGTRWCEQRNYFGTGSSDVPGIVLYP